MTTDSKGCPRCGRPQPETPTAKNPSGDLYRCRCGAQYGPGAAYVAGQNFKKKSSVPITRTKTTEEE